MDAYEIDYQLKRVMQEHREVDDAIHTMERQSTVDMIEIQRLKKRKLALKDQIATLEAMQHPDIIA